MNAALRKWADLNRDMHGRRMTPAACLEMKTSTGPYLASQKTARYVILHPDCCSTKPQHSNIVKHWKANLAPHRNGRQPGLDFGVRRTLKRNLIFVDGSGSNQHRYGTRHTSGIRGSFPDGRSARPVRYSAHVHGDETTATCMAMGSDGLRLLGHKIVIRKPRAYRPPASPHCPRSPSNPHGRRTQCHAGRERPVVVLETMLHRDPLADQCVGVGGAEWSRPANGGGGNKARPTLLD